MLKYHLNLVRVCYQNPSIFAPNSIPKTHVKPTSFLDAVLVSKSMRMKPKGNSKYLVGTAQIDFGSTLTTSSLILGLEATLTSPQGAHFVLIWILFGPHFQALQPALTSFSGQISCAKQNVAKHSFSRMSLTKCMFLPLLGSSKTISKDAKPF